MKLKTSFFNFTVFRKDITRFAPVWGIYAIGGVITLLQTALLNLISATQFTVVVASTMQSFVFLNMIYGLINALLLFGDLFKSRLCNGIHAMPLRRETLFATHFLAGLCFSMVPNLAFSLLITLMCSVHWYLGPIWFLCMTLQYLLFFSIAVFAIMCTGKKSAATVVYFILNYLSYIVLWFYSVIYAPLLPGLEINKEPFSLFCPSVALTSKPVLHVEKDFSQSMTGLRFYGFDEGWTYLWIIGAVALVFALLALLLYRRRALENAGDFIAAPFFRPIFLGIYTLSTSAMFQLVFSRATVLLPVSLAFGFFTGLMLLQRKVNVFNRRNLITFGIVAGLVLSSIFLTALDPAGLTRWTPQPEQVASITISNDYSFEMTDDNSDRITLTDDASIADLIDIHTELISQPPALFNIDTYASDQVYFVYTLKNGNTIQRKYTYNLDDPIADRLRYYYLSPEYVLGYENWDSFLSSVSKIELAQVTLYGNRARELLTAMKADCEAHRDGKLNSDTWDDYALIYQGEDFRHVSINEHWTNTINWLNQNAPEWDD